MKYHTPMMTIDIRFNPSAALKLVRRDLRAMRRTDKVMYYSLIGAVVFLLLDFAVIGFALYMITKTH